MNAINISFFHVGPNPEIVRVDERDDGLARYDDLALQGRPHIHNPINRRANFSVTQARLRLFLLRAGGRQLVDIGFKGCPARGDLFCIGFGQRHCRLGRLHLFTE